MIFSATYTICERATVYNSRNVVFINCQHKACVSSLNFVSIGHICLIVV